MVKKKTIVDNTKYRPELLEDIMGAGFGRYAKYIIQEQMCIRDRNYDCGSRRMW